LKKDPPCDLRCPDSSYTDEEWHKLNVITLVGSSLSIIGMGFLIVSCIPNTVEIYVYLNLTKKDLVQYERRRFPSSIHIWEFVATSFFAISFLINGQAPEKNVWCYDEGTSATQSNNTACGVQGISSLRISTNSLSICWMLICIVGFFFIVFGISLTAWCFVIAFIMCYAIVLNKKVSNLQRYVPFFHLFAWGFPLVS
jgi:hypothetical protein